jgi:hypothetical protein
MLLFGWSLKLGPPCIIEYKVLGVYFHSSKRFLGVVLKNRISFASFYAP